MTGVTDRGKGTTPFHHAEVGSQPAPQQKTITFRDVPKAPAPPTRAPAAVYHGQSRTDKAAEMDSGDAQRQLSQYRENLARQMESRDPPMREMPPPGPGPARISPIQEESSVSP